jgi:hypothetical protein
MIKKNKNVYKYTTFILAVLLIFILFYYLSHNFEKSVNNTTTAIETSTILALQCNIHPAVIVYVGNNLICGPFEAKFVNITSSNKVSLLVYYNGNYAKK